MVSLERIVLADETFVVEVSCFLVTISLFFSC